MEIIGLVPNIAHTGYHILYRGLEAKLLPHKLTIGNFYPWFCARKHSLHRVVVRFELPSPWGQLITLKGAQAAPADLVEYYVECDLVARGLIDGQIRYIQKLIYPGALW